MKNKEAYILYQALNKSDKLEIIDSLLLFSEYLKATSMKNKEKHYSNKFIYEWTFKKNEDINNNKNYLLANLIAASESFTRIIEKAGNNAMTVFTNRLLTDFVCDLKPFINHFDKDQDYTWLHFNTNTHPHRFYFSLLNNIFFMGLPNEHLEEKLVLNMMSPFLIRQCIEYKISGILGIEYILIDGKPDKGSMEKLFKVIRENKRFYKTKIDFELLKRIYEWTNMYIHQGYRPEPWKTETAIHCLKDLFYIGPISNENFFSVNAGIEVDEKDLIELKTNTYECLNKQIAKKIFIKPLKNLEVTII